MKRVFLIVHTKLFFQRMLELGQIISKFTDYKLIFHFAQKDKWINIIDDIKILEAQNFEISNDTKQYFINKKTSIEKEKKIWQPFIVVRLKSFVYNKLHRIIFILTFIRRLLRNNFFTWFLRIRKHIFYVRNLLDKVKIDIVIMSYDNPTWDTGIYIRAARMNRVPTLIFFSQTGPLDEMLNVVSRKNKLCTKLPQNWILGKIFKKWVNQKNGKKFLMMSFSETLAKELLGVSMPQPWLESSSYADAVLIECEKYLSRGIEAGLFSDNLYVTGYPYHDILYYGLINQQDNLKKIYTIHNLKQRKPILLTSLLPNYQTRDNSESDFHDYWEMVTFWIKSLVKYEQFHTIVSLHPSQQREEYSIIEELGAKIARLQITEIIPVCYAYIACLSSTITMALACSKPVINYDYAHYRNTHYKDALGVINVETRDEFVRSLEKLLCNSEFYNNIVTSQSAEAKQWGNIDGRATERIIHVINETSNKFSSNSDTHS